jgi:hypothetical protein
MSAAIFICSFSSGLDDMPRKDQRDIAKVLRVLEQCGRFSVFEATDNQTIATTMTKLCHSNLIETDNSCGYPWTKVKLTEAGRSYLQDAPNVSKGDKP